MSSAPTLAEHLIATLAERGVRRMFGVPGGGSSLDLIEAGAVAGIEFVLARDESAALMMAAVTAELSGTPGVALTTKGPGTANAVNGFAYAALDRAPLVLFTDGFTPEERHYVTHQVYDQRALLAPLAKGATRLEGADPVDEFDALLQRALTPPLGPVLIELTSEAARRRVARARGARVESDSSGPSTDASAAAELLRSAKYPVLILGLEARYAASAAAVRALAEALRCPVLATYKAMGVLPATHPLYVGGFTSGAAELETVGRADLIVLAGLDPVELLRQPWRYTAPVIELALAPHPIHYLRPTAALHGPIAPSLDRLRAIATPSTWTTAELETLRGRMRAALAYRARSGLGPQRIVEAAAEASRSLAAWPRITVDAGAHMFSAMAFWPCEMPCGVLISNGLATMAFALPAAIASALQEPERTTIAFTGDGGLFMCLAELSTAVAVRARIVVVVFNDGALSLIDIKQQQRALPARGVRWERPDFAQVMRGLGGRGWRVSGEAGYRAALREALAEDGPGLIDVIVDPSGYREQLQALRG